ncbi:MAG: hypothetical protein JRC99_01085 [Deltaproteobacteria bacterium]|nr:hypothetical protein [Deltaproteobacteria bacterium]
MAFIRNLCFFCFISVVITSTVTAAVGNGDFSLVTNPGVDDDLDQHILLAQADTGATATKSQGGEKKVAGGYTQAQINEMINNPLGELWMIWTQNDTIWMDGDILDDLHEDPKRFNVTTIEPVLPFQLTEDWKVIFRPVIPIVSIEEPDSISIQRPEHLGEGFGLDVDWERETGLGDIILWNAFTRNDWSKPPKIFGFGVTAMLPTATDDVLGTEKWSAGPMAVVFHVGEPGGFIVGTVAQHWWSFAGDDDREDVNLTNIQYFDYYRYSDATNIGFSPNISANWEMGNSDVWTVPIGGGFNHVTKFGPLPVRLGVEVYYHVVKPDAFGPTWQLRLTFIPVVPKPAATKRPMFGS